MLNRKLILAVAATLCALTLPAEARVDVDVHIVPPLPRLDRIAAPPVGHVWVPGFWRWEGRRHIWNSGYWMRQPSRPYWVRDRWSHDGDRHETGRREPSGPRARDSERRDRTDESGSDRRGGGRG